MKVIEQFSSVDETGRRISGRREIDIPGVITEAEAKARDAAAAPERQRLVRIDELKAQMAETLLDQALGADVTERVKGLRAEYAALKG